MFTKGDQLDEICTNLSSCTTGDCNVDVWQFFRLLKTKAKDTILQRNTQNYYRPIFYYYLCFWNNLILQYNLLVWWGLSLYEITNKPQMSGPKEHTKYVPNWHHFISSLCDTNVIFEKLSTVFLAFSYCTGKVIVICKW